MHGVPVAADQLPVMEAALAKANLKGYEVRGTSIFVPRGQEAAYMAALADAKALPPNFGAALTPGRQRRHAGSSSVRSGNNECKIAKQDDLGADHRQDARHRACLCALRRRQQARGFQGKSDHGHGLRQAGRLRPTRRSAGLGHSPSRGRGHRRPETGKRHRLRPQRRRTWYGNAEDDAGGAEGNLYISVKRTYEQDLKAKILNALCYIPNVTVESSVELDRERRPASSRTNTRRRRIGRTAASGPRARQGQPDQPLGSRFPAAEHGHGAQGSAGRRASEGPEPERRTPVSQRAGGEGERRPDADPGQGVGGRADQLLQEGLAGAKPRRARPAPKTPDQAALDQIRIEESAKIQRHVAQLLPSTESAAKAAELVTVTTFQDIPVAEPPAPGFQQERAELGAAVVEDVGHDRLGVDQSAGIAVDGPRAAICGRGRAGGRRRAPTVGRRRMAGQATTGGHPSSARPRLLRRPDAGRSRDELSELVEDDPEAAANVLRSWIGHVG